MRLVTVGNPEIFVQDFLPEDKISLKTQKEQISAFFPYSMYHKLSKNIGFGRWKSNPDAPKVWRKSESLPKPWISMDINGFPLCCLTKHKGNPLISIEIHGFGSVSDFHHTLAHPGFHFHLSKPIFFWKLMMYTIWENCGNPLVLRFKRCFVIWDFFLYKNSRVPLPTYLWERDISPPNGNYQT